MEHTDISNTDRLAAELALAAIKGGHFKSVKSNQAEPRIDSSASNTETSKVFQAWFQYFRQLQQQDSQITHWLTGQSLTGQPGTNFAGPAMCQVTPCSLAPTDVKTQLTNTPRFSSSTTNVVHTEQLPVVMQPAVSIPGTSSAFITLMPTGGSDSLPCPDLPPPSTAQDQLLRWISDQAHHKEQTSFSTSPSTIQDKASLKTPFNSPFDWQAFNQLNPSASTQDESAVCAPETVVSTTEARQPVEQMNQARVRNESMNSTGDTNESSYSRFTSAAEMMEAESLEKIMDHVSVCDESPCKSPSRSDVGAHDAQYLTQWRPRLRLHNKDRFIVRVIRITYQCPQCGPDTKRVTQSLNECADKEPHIYVTFQARLPSISFAGRNNMTGVSTQAPATGLRLVFTCALDGDGPAIQEFETPKVAERLDVWEQAGGMPGFRSHVLPSLHDTVVLILRTIRENGLAAIPLDTDYVFFPYTNQLRQPSARRRELSASSDSSVTRLSRRLRNSTESSSMEHRWDDLLKPVESELEEQSEQPRSQQTAWPVHLEAKQYNARRPTHLWQSLQKSEGHSPVPISTHVNPNMTRLHPLTCLASCSGNDAQNSRLVPHSLRMEQHANSCECVSQPNAQKYLNAVSEASYPQFSGAEVTNRAVRILNQQHLLLNGKSVSTPVSPTTFTKYPHRQGAKRSDCLYESTINGPCFNINTWNEGPQPGSPAIPETTGSKPHQTKGTDDTQVSQEILNRLRSNPTLPLVIMPVVAPEHPQTNASSREIRRPLIFQVPHPDTAFVCLPANSNQAPRVVTAPRDGTVLVIPSPEANRDGVGQQTTPNWAQPLVLTGPRPGYLLIVNAENRAVYVPAQQRSDAGESLNQASKA